MDAVCHSETPAWFKRAVIGDKIVAVKSYRNRLNAEKTYRISGFYNRPGMTSEYGPYPVGLTIVGNNMVIFDPRCFRPVPENDSGFI